MVAICMLSLLSRKLLTSVSVTGLGIFGIACMIFMYVFQISTFDINIESRTKIFSECVYASGHKRIDQAQSEW